jgi:molybdopterin-guanine dinucleotide biosynthesis protein A
LSGPGPVPRCVGGIFVGGRSTRMGGRPKGLLAAPDGGTLVERSCRVLAAAEIDDVVLVGAQAAYAPLGLPMLDDEPPGTGPLGGILALLGYATRMQAPFTMALACDMPFVSEGLITRLRDAPLAAVIAPRRNGRWEPLCARYESGAAATGAHRLVTGDYSLQRWLDGAGAVELPLTEEEARELDDWDTPEDASRASSGRP